MMVFATLYVIAATALAWTPSYTFYVIITFIVGFTAVGFFMPNFVIGKYTKCSGNIVI